MKITVNGESISKEVFEQEVQNQKRQNPKLSDEQIKNLAKQSIIDWTIIRQEANKEIKTVPKVLIENEFAKLVEQHGGDDQFYRQFNISAEEKPKVFDDLEQNIKINQFLKNKVKNTPEPSDAEIQHYYKSHAKDFTIPESIHAAHIVMRPNPTNPKVAYNEMIDIRQQLLKGADFRTLANEFSSCQDEGGDLGYFTPGNMVEEFDAVVFSMNIGEISPVFLTQFGYHIATVFDKKPAELKSINECQEEIIDKIKTDQGDDLIGKWVDKKKEKAKIVIVDDE